MQTFVLTGVHPPGVNPPYDRQRFTTLVLRFVTQDPQAAAAYVYAVEHGQQRLMSGPPGVIATELDLSGVYFHP